MPSHPPAAPGPGTPQPPDEPVTVVCAATYYADQHDAYAFVFRIPSTATRFTIHATSGYRYEIGVTYLLTLTPADNASAATTNPEGEPS
jgi:hypothetical protein